MSEDSIEHWTLIQERSQPEAVRRGRIRVVAVEPERFGKPRERTGEVALVDDANSVLDVHPHQPPADFLGAGIGQKTRFALAVGGRFFARGSRSRRFGQSMLAKRVEPSRRPRPSRGTPPRSPTVRRRRDCGAHHRHARSNRPIGRAAIGSPESQRSRSAATAFGRAITPARVFLQALQRDGLKVTIDALTRCAGRDRLLFPNLRRVSYTDAA